MSLLPIIILSLIWLAGTCLRIYRQARFFQIEEYMSQRYVRWLFGARSRWLPTRPVLAWFISSILIVLLSEAPGPFVPWMVAVIAAVIAVIPPGEGEIKKAFRRTRRAMRMLGAAFLLAALLIAAGSVLLALRFGETGAPEFLFVFTGTLGVVALIAAPFLLIAGSLLMTPIEALIRQRFIAKARRTLKEIDPVVIGITGSYGKTSTKAYLSHILNGRYHAYPTPKSYNTLMGVCLAINTDLAQDRRVEYFVCEMGAYIPGEIARICKLTHPKISIVVEVGPQHLERFGSLENIAIAKYEIVTALPPDGTAIFNWDNEYVRQMYERGYPQTRLAVSKRIDPAQVPPGGPRFIATDISETLEGLRFVVHDVERGEQAEFNTTLLGEHNVTNILLATAVAVHEGMPLREVAARCRSLQPAESRLVRQVTPEGITIINDAYSANPVGVISSLRALALHQTGRRLLITPGMVELGDLMESENRRLGERAAQYATDVILVGSVRTAPIRTGLLDAGFDAERVRSVETLTEAVEWYKRNLKPGDTVLFLNDLPDTYSS
ncbi:UDP-N-acetylmuramoyl-tripeptide--D-alanyl-D-alanine ligase [Anaerolineae bacterium CFX9]|nr:UDP-N-acetylmuramoyl-tripeptide--D-alanyl-D-alanine ligase [Anaerolineae bacterium CFX9]